MNNLLYFSFNRPDLTGKSLSELLKLKWDNILVIIDGPRTEIERITTDLTYDVISELVLRFNKGKVEIIRRENNYGCRRNLELSLEYFFKKYSAGWVFEDDILIKNIKEFELIRRKTTILGHYSLFNPVEVDVSQRFERIDNGHFYIWGWYLNSNTKLCFKQNLSLLGIMKIIKVRGLAKGLRFIYTLLRTLNNQIDTWDSIYTYWAIKNAIPSFVPMRSLVENIGFDERATHTITPSNDKNKVMRKWKKTMEKIVK